MLVLLAFSMTNILLGPAHAQDANPNLEEDIRNRAKKRIYPGGRDEEPLQVQPQINRVARKQAESPEANTRSSQDND